MAKKSYKSSNGNSYTIEGNDKQGYRAIDNQNNESSAWASDTVQGMEKVIEQVESGTRQDAGNFGKH